MSADPVSHPTVTDELVKLYSDTYAEEAQKRLREIHWTKEPNREANAATDAAYWESKRIALAAVLAAVAAPAPDLTDDQLAQCIADPGSIVGYRRNGETPARWAVRAIRAAGVGGVPDWRRLNTETVQGRYCPGCGRVAPLGGVGAVPQDRETGQ